jgi:hypothetical protein
MRTTLWAVVVVVVLGLGGWYWYAHSTGVSNGTTANQQAAQGAAGAPGTVASGNSDTALNADLATMDTQLKSTQQDSTSVDQSLNDQPIQQTE